MDISSNVKAKYTTEARIIERAFLNVGTIDDAIEKGERLLSQAKS